MLMKKITVAGAFEDIRDQLVNALLKADFSVAEEVSYNEDQLKNTSSHFRKHAVIVVDSSKFSSAMIELNIDLATEVMPCLVSLTELYPGEISIALLNPTAMVAGDEGNWQLESLAHQESILIEKIINSVGGKADKAPDLVTSWS